MMNAIIQPVHLLLYTALVGASISLAIKNPIYAIVAIAFMVPAEKFIKKLFGINSETTSGMGSLAAGALGLAGLQKMAKIGKNVVPHRLGANAGNKDDGTSGDSNGEREYIREANMDNLALFGGSPKDEKETKSGQSSSKSVREAIIRVKTIQKKRMKNKKC